MPPVLLPPLQCAMSAPAPAVMAEGLEATRQEKWRKKHREQVVAAAASSESPQPPVTPDSKVEFPAPITRETLTSTAVAAGKGHKRKKQELAASSLLVKEAVRMEEKKKRKRSNQEAAAAATPSPSTTAAAAAAQILEVAAEGAAARKVRKRVKLEKGQSGQPPSPIYVHPQGGGAETDGGVGGSKSVRRSSSGKPRVLTNQELLRMIFQEAKGKPLPQGFSPPVANPNYMDEDPKYCSPHGAFFHQFRYIPESQQGCNARPLPKTPHPPEKKPKKKSPGLSAAEKRSDNYRRLPLDELVPALRSPYKLLQEEYADDPWKVMVICIFLNCTAGVQVKRILKGFFKRYPDAQTASAADHGKMAGYLAHLGFQNVKASRIQRFSKGYVGEEWTYVTELYGVGKYAADAYAIFCAGRATEVVPEDHKLVPYWKYVCKVLDKAKQNVPEAAGEAVELCP